MKNKLSLVIFSKSEDKQYMYLRHLALTFRASLPLLSELFQIPEDELYKKLLDYNTHAYRALIFLFQYDLSDQEVVRKEIVAFYRNLLNAIMNKDKEEQRHLINLISDASAQEIAKKGNRGDALSDDDIMIIIRHQLKYALSFKATSEIFGINKSAVYRRVQKLIKNNPELQSSYERLTTFSETAWDKKRN